MTKPMIDLSVRGSRIVENTLRNVAPKEGLLISRSAVGKMASDVMRHAKKKMGFSKRVKAATKKVRHRVRGGIIQEDIVVQRGPFWWRFFEYGQGASPRVAMFAGALNWFRPRLVQHWERHFMKAFADRLARVRRANLARSKRSP